MNREVLPPRFGELSNEEKAKLVLGHYCEGKTLQFFSNFTDTWQKIGGSGDPCWISDYRYRLAPEPEIPDSIDWDHVADGFDIMTRGSEPSSSWLHSGVISYPARIFASYKRGNMSSCTVKRPK